MDCTVQKSSPFLSKIYCQIQVSSIDRQLESQVEHSKEIKSLSDEIVIEVEQTSSSTQEINAQVQALLAEMAHIANFSSELYVLSEKMIKEISVFKL